MKAEYWTIISCGVFFALIAPIYWVISEDPTGTTALVMTFLLCALLGFYLYVVAKQIPDRPEDRSDGEIAEGAGEQGGQALARAEELGRGSVPPKTQADVFRNARAALS